MHSGRKINNRFSITANHRERHGLRSTAPNNESASVKCGGRNLEYSTAKRRQNVLRGVMKVLRCGCSLRCAFRDLIAENPDGRATDKTTRSRINRLLDIAQNA